MGIEPTGLTVYASPNGFEIRGHHQVCRHLQRHAEPRKEAGPRCLGWLILTSIPAQSQAAPGQQDEADRQMMSLVAIAWRVVRIPAPER